MNLSTLINKKNGCPKIFFCDIHLTLLNKNNKELFPRYKSENPCNLRKFSWLLKFSQALQYISILLGSSNFYIIIKQNWYKYV